MWRGFFLATVPLALKAAEEQGVAKALATGRVTLATVLEVLSPWRSH